MWRILKTKRILDFIYLFIYDDVDDSIDEV